MIHLITHLSISFQFYFINDMFNSLFNNVFISFWHFQCSVVCVVNCILCYFSIILFDGSDIKQALVSLVSLDVVDKARSFILLLRDMLMHELRRQMHQIDHIKYGKRGRVMKYYSIKRRKKKEKGIIKKEKETQLEVWLLIPTS